MSSDDATLVIYDVHGEKRGTATLVEGEVIFPTDEFTWIWTLDARHPPYCEQTLEDVLHRAEHANKRYVLWAEGGSDEAGDE